MQPRQEGRNRGYFGSIAQDWDGGKRNFGDSEISRKAHLQAI